MTNASRIRCVGAAVLAMSVTAIGASAVRAQGQPGGQGG